MRKNLEFNNIVFIFASRIKREMEKKKITLKTLNKSNVWDIQENDVFRLWESAEKDADLKDNQRSYLQVVKSAFDMEEIQVDRPEVIRKYEERGFKIGMLRIDDEKKKWAVKKHPIMRLNDLTYENIRHISAAKLVEVLNRNFGGGWDSVSQNIQDIITSGFDISTTTLPNDRIHKPGGMYEKMVNEGYEVLEIPMGTWTEAIFAKEKPKVEKIHTVFDSNEELDKLDKIADYGETGSDEEDTIDSTDDYIDGEEEEDTFDDDKLTEESYRTTFEEPEDLGLEDVSDEEDY